VADDHAAHRKAVPQLAGRPGNLEAAAAAAVGFTCRDEDIPEAFCGNKIGAEMEPTHPQNGFAHVALSFAQSSAGKDLENV
jgi:hypothetical protein